LVQYNTRYYSPSMGRFVNRDPLGEQGGHNLYAYVRNNAINRWDYLGMIEPPPEGWEGTEQDWINWVSMNTGPNYQTDGSLNAFDGLFGGDFVGSMTGNDGAAWREATLAPTISYDQAFSAYGSAGVRDNTLFIDTKTGALVATQSGGVGAFNYTVTGVSLLAATGNLTATSQMTASAPNSGGTVAGGSGRSALGNLFRHVPFLGGTLGAVGDVASGVGNVALGVASFGQSGTFGRGLGQVGSGVGVFAADIGAAAYGFSIGKITSVALGAGNLLTGNYFAANYPNDPKPESRGFFSGVSNFVRSVVIPTYGFNLGVNYGGVQQGFVPPQSARSFNQLDSVSYQHDLDQNNRNWVRSSSSSQGGTTPTGPVGAIINIIGAPVFWLTPSR